MLSEKQQELYDKLKEIKNLKIDNTVDGFPVRFLSHHELELIFTNEVLKFNCYEKENRILHASGPTQKAGYPEEMLWNGTLGGFSMYDLTGSLRREKRYYLIEFDETPAFLLPGAAWPNTATFHIQ